MKKQVRMELVCSLRTVLGAVHSFQLMKSDPGLNRILFSLQYCGYTPAKHRDKWDKLKQSLGADHSLLLSVY